MSQEVGVDKVYLAIEEAFKKNDLEKVEGLLMPALDQFPELSRFWFYAGCLQFKRGHCALAAQSFERALDLDDAHHVYSNLGACYRRMNRNEEGLAILLAGLDRQPDYAPALVNVGSMFVNEGCPERGIPYLEKAVEIGGERGAVWNLGLLYLESARFGEGFDLYREGVTHERAVRKYGHGDVPDPKLMTAELFEEARASGERRRLILWGEQGIGDELMFCTILEELRRDFDVVFECHPRLERLHRNAHPGLTLYPTRKEERIAWPITDKVTADYKMPIGDMGCYYRRDLQSFKDAWARTGPTYRANPVETARYRAALEEIAQGRPIIGLATRGGVMQTSRGYRTIRLPEIERLMRDTEALYVALDYDDMLKVATHVDERFGPERYKWFPSVVQHWDYDHTAALIAATDMTVSVCQSAAHLSAAMGHPTRVLTPTRCAWRYTPIKDEPELWYWYPDVERIRCYRQDDPESWDHPLDRVIADIKELQ